MKSIASKGRFTPGQVVYAEGAGDDRGPVRMRLVRHYEHPAGNGWEVNIYDPRRRRFSEVVQCVSDEAIARSAMLDMLAINGREEVEGWIKSAMNCVHAAIDDRGDVTIADPQKRHTLSGEKLVELVNMINAGV